MAPVTPSPPLQNGAVQLSLFPDYQPRPRWALRLHHSGRPHFDLRLEAGGTLLSFLLFAKPSLNPSTFVRARLVPEPSMSSTVPVDLGRFVPIMNHYSTYDLEVLDQLSKGDVRLTLQGRHLNGLWQLWGSGTCWNFQKLEDAYASTTQVLRLDPSDNASMYL